MPQTAIPNALLTLILGAGKGTRMKSARPKVMHAVAGRSMLGHVIATARSVGTSSMATVVGPAMDDVAAETRKHMPDAQVFVQTDQRGTADAVLAARAALKAHTGHVLAMSWS
jgi:bifunctional UDP-N-acetylglucosamine pyrophosphorylase / glucosamine-1-phosphate N-acetyltransferase